MTGEPENPDRKNNLWQPVPGDHGAHGPFSGEALNFSVQTWATTHPRLLAGIFTVISMSGIYLFLRKSGLVHGKKILPLPLV